MAKMTLMGLNNYDGHLFDTLTVPAGINKETLVNNILIKSGDYEVLYPNVSFCKQAIAVWSSKWQRTMEKWVSTLGVDWNPIENYDRYEEWDESSEHSGRSTDTSNTTSSGSDSNTTSGSGTNTATKSAFDSSTYEPDNKAESSTTGTSSTTTQSTLNGSASGTQNDTNTSQHTGHIHGNIGVTTSSSMYLEYQDAARWNIYEQITDLFLTEFVIPIL